MDPQSNEAVRQMTDVNADAVRPQIQRLLADVLPHIVGVTCENTYEGEGKAKCLASQRITLDVKRPPGFQPDR
jgi:agmatine/peptidylarginine deiminase